MHLHIISLTVPFPVDYGGVFDLFYKLPALQQQGVQIHLHCFDYGRGVQEALNQYCNSVHYYQRKRFAFSRRLPYIVASRNNKDLLNRLLQDDYPILMEGVHCSFLLTDQRFAKRLTFLRLHNVEFEYYADLAKTAESVFRRWYYRRESKLLQQYEQRIAGLTSVLTVTPKDAGRYQSFFKSRETVYLPLFLPPWHVQIAAGLGAYCLYQGDLSVDANVAVVKWLIDRVFADIDVPLKIAGKNPPQQLLQLAATCENVTVVPNPSESQMQQLISQAQINILPSFSSTGIKLKLLNALYNGRHCVVNDETVAGTGLEALCYIANSDHELKEKVLQLFRQPLDDDETNRRQALLAQHFNNERNAQQLVTLINNARQQR